MNILAIGGIAMLGTGTPAMAVDGAALFKSRCGTCHWDPGQAGEKPRIGPSLKGVIGRTAGSSDFKRYSPAMKKAGFSWTASNLDAYLDNPRGNVSGTTMAFVGLKWPDEREAVIKYLLKTGK